MTLFEINKRLSELGLHDNHPFDGYYNSEFFERNGRKTNILTHSLENFLQILPKVIIRNGLDLQLVITCDFKAPAIWILAYADERSIDNFYVQESDKDLKIALGKLLIKLIEEGLFKV